MTKEQLDEMMNQFHSYCNDPESAKHKHIFVAGYQRGHRTGVESEKNRAHVLVEALKRATDAIGDMCIFPEKRKWEWETTEKNAARKSLDQYQKGDK